MSNAAKMVRFIMGNPYIRVSFNEQIEVDDIKIIRSEGSREIIGIEPITKKELGKQPNEFREGLEFYSPINFKLNVVEEQELVEEESGFEQMKKRLERIKKNLKK